MLINASNIGQNWGQKVGRALFRSMADFTDEQPPSPRMVWFTSPYPLVNIYSTMENHNAING